ncbi:MAG: flagellar hook-length control protein FliK [Campylobacteraceae bacterium]|nr:flagellar hook-length control protein FliK [Campylobacteraceae bacterium]
MQNLISIIASNPKTVNIPKETKGVESVEPKQGSKDFVSILFEQIKNSVKTPLKTDDKLSSEVKIDLDKLLKSDKKKSADELVLNEVLSILQTLKNSSDEKISFPKFSDKLEKVLTNKSILNELKDVKDISDLMKLSKKYNLGLENIKFTKEKIQTIEKDFPKLDVKSFFNDEAIKETKIISTDSKLTKSQKTIIIEKLIDNLDKSKKTIEKNPKNILQTLLKNVDTESKKVIIKTNEEDKKDKVTKFIKEDKKVSLKSSDKDKIVIKEDKKVSLKSSDKDKIVIKEAEKTSDKVNIKDNSIKNLATNTLNKKEVVIAQVDKKLNKKDITNKKKEIKDLTEKTTLIKEIKKTTVHTKQVTKDFTPNNLQTEKNDNSNNIQNINTKINDTDDSNKEIKEVKEVKIEPNIQKTEAKTTFKADKNTDTKQSLNQFSNDLKEKMETYKPPIMKLQMTLTPKNLGEVEVTLLNRGNNLHVNITSNTNTMSLFTQNQAEFKNSLVNMGFTNLEMNFSDQGKSNQQHQNSRKNSNVSLEEIKNQENQESTVELIVPQYV